MIDIFVSYARADAAVTEILAGRLVERSLTVFLDEWHIGPGEIVVHRLEQALRESRNGIVVISEAALRSPRAMEEYAALLTASTSRGLRLIPVLVGNAELPPFAHERVWRDLRGLSPRELAARADELADIVEGRSPSPGPRPEDELEPGSGLTEPDPHNLVVCHVGADRDYADRLVRLLRAESLPVWWRGDLRPGDVRFTQIRRQLRHAVAVLVLMSPAAQGSDEITRMIIEAELHARHPVPILLKGPRHYQLAHLWYFDARHGELPGPAELAILRQLHEADVRGTPVAPGEVLPPPFAEPAVATVRLPLPASLSRLARLLADGDLLGADLFTTVALLDAADRLDSGFLQVRDGRSIPLRVLAGIDALWAEHTQGAQGFRRQRRQAEMSRDTHTEVRRLQRALGWRDASNEPVERHYGRFAERADGWPGFFPTLRNPHSERHLNWYDRWTDTVRAVHLRLRDWKDSPS
ncbi:hypothetical protein Acor_57390 [Acrocarpospora corrugata]|uniref:TIR domain-containing protein n=1 Tax=Acrocarpospora corrugata TaxID=35763 RepID=A0A5M3W916_9ACTN|nr:TIR domain-containing protein [Acrocarpospora corrugata]GES03673.1 hypothetical protein Acor_57390 [Acrocarpospora corrugata]